MKQIDQKRKYVVVYYYIKRREGVRLTNPMPYYVYPKPYRSIVDGETLQRILKHYAFICETSSPENGKSSMRAHVDYYYPAQKKDIKRYKELKVQRFQKMGRKQNGAWFRFIKPINKQRQLARKKVQKHRVKKSEMKRAKASKTGN